MEPEPKERPEDMRRPALAPVAIMARPSLNDKDVISPSPSRNLGSLYWSMSRPDMAPAFAAPRSRVDDRAEPVRPDWRRDLARLALVATVFFFLFLGTRPLGNPDEGRYTEIPSEMALSNDYITPRLDGVKYFEKPPLLYWLSAVTFEVAGVNEWSARSWCALFAVLGTLLTYAGGRVLYGRQVGIFSAAVLALSSLYYVLSRVVLLDLAVTVFIAAALFSFLAGVRELPGRKRRLFFWGFYAGMALATLTKGLIGIVLPCAVAGTWVLVCHQWKRLRPFYWPSGLVIVLAIAGPWHVLAARANADFLQFYFVHEHFQRFTTQVHARYQPWWFFIPVLMAGLMPGIVFAAQALRHNLASGWKGRVRESDAWFLILWIVVIVAFFSKSQSKLVPYITPVLPAAAVLIGRYLAARWSEGMTGGLRAGLWGFVMIAVVLAAALAAVPVSIKYPEVWAAIQPWRIVLPALLGGGALVVAGFVWRGNARGAIAAMAITFGLFLIAANGVGAVVDTRSTKSLALALKPRLQPGDAVFCVGEYFQDFPVYLGRLVDVVGYKGELTFGIDAEPAYTAGRFIDGAKFNQRWQQAPVAYALIERASLPMWFADPALPRSVVAASARYVLLVNRNP